MNGRRFSMIGFVERYLLGSFSLRTKLILGNMLVTFLAILAMGYYVYYRAQESSADLSGQLEANVRAKAEETLQNAGEAQASQLDAFFASMRKNTSVIAAIEQSMFSQETTLYNAVYWDALAKLSRLPNGSWDNSNDEVASVFIPANIELTEPLAAKLNIAKQTELIVPSVLEDNPDIIAIYFGGESGETIYYPNIDLANIVPPDFDVTGRPWYVDAAPAQNPERNVVWSTPYQDAALNGLVITASAPVFNTQDDFHGVAAMDIQLNKITEIVGNIKVGESGYAFLVDQDNRLIALPAAGYEDFGVVAETVPAGEILDQTKLPNASSELFNLLALSSVDLQGAQTIVLRGIERYVVFQPVPEVNYRLVIIAPSAELLAESIQANEQIARESENTIRVSILLVALIIALAALATLAVGNRLTTPLNSLTSVAKQITAGNYDVRAEIQSQDEIGVLAETTNAMTAAIKNSFASLEQRVAERTQQLKDELEKGAHRSKQLETVNRVSQTISAAKSMQETLPQIAKVIRDQFGFYHVGIFLNDATNQYTILSAVASSDERATLNRGYQIKVGEQGIVGYTTGTGEPRIAMDIVDDSAYYSHPDLPLTRSEMALPLKISNRVVGALDIQSAEENAFTEDDVEVLTSLAEQVSLAIQNARLIDENQKTLAESEAIQRQYLRETWSRLPQEEKISGFRYSITGAEPLESNVPAITSDGRREVSVPIILRGEKIGTLAVQVPKEDRVSPDQVDLIKAVAERVALSAENARLFEDATQRAERERIVSDISAKIGTSVRTENILKTTARELSQLLGDADILIRLKTDELDGSK